MIDSVDFVEPTLHCRIKSRENENFNKRERGSEENRGEKQVRTRSRRHGASFMIFGPSVVNLAPKPFHFLGFKSIRSPVLSQLMNGPFSFFR